MKLASHLKCSPFGVYYFRLVVPKRLRPSLGGQTEVKRSLRTKDPALARRRAYILSARLDNWLQQASRVMTDTPSERRKILERYRDSLLREIDSYMGYRYSDMVFTERGYEMKRSAHTTAELQSLIHQLESLEKTLATLDGPTVPATEPPPHPAQGTRLSVAVDAYLSLERAGKTVVKTKMAVEKALARFRQWIADLANAPGSTVTSATGAHIARLEADPLLATIEPQHIVAYMHHMLQNESAGRGGAARKASAEGADGNRGLSKATTYKELGFLNGFFGAMQRHAYFPKTMPVPTRDVSPYKRGEKKRSVRQTRYLPFERQELAKIFDPFALGALRKPHEFWVPLLGLYTGARLDELCQLRLQDIQRDGGRLVIAITHTDDTKTKTTGSERLVPLHDELLSLGFDTYVADVRQAAGDEARLFPYLLRTVNGYADVPSEAFSRYLDKVGITSERKTFHSFRSTINEAFARAGVAEEARSQLLGHAYDTTNLTHYGKAMQTEELYSATLAKITFPAVVEATPALRYRAGQFSAVLHSELERRRASEENRKLRQQKGLPPLRSAKKTKA
ncbi:MAG: site-specific integrase [Burkholderiales bacterium]|nr:site-specific integrase [Burkholderiales bacterium]